MRRMLLAITSVLIIGGALIAVGAVLYSQRISNGQIYTDGQSIRKEADSAPIRQMLWRDPIAFELPIDLRGASELQLSASGDVIIYVRATQGERLNLYESHKTPTGWTDATPIAALNTRDNELSPALSPDGQRLVFASDRTGGLGGYDLWWSQRSNDGRWETPVNAGAINSTANDYAASFMQSGTELYLTSDRLSAPLDNEHTNITPDDAQWAERLRSSQAQRVANIFTAPVGQTGFGTARAVDALCSEADDTAPAFSPAGDFVYFASNRIGGVGGFDIYRSRIVDNTVLPPEPLGTPVNTPADELDPMPWMDGFAIVYTIALQNSPVASLLEARSREVYLDRDAVLAHQRSAAMWEMLWPWILGILLLVLLLVFLASLINASRSERLARGWRRLSLLAKCILASVAMHMLLMLLFAAWTVGSALGEYLQRPQGTRVALIDRGAAGGAGDIAQQIHAAMTQATTDPAELAQRERAQMMLHPSTDVSMQRMNAEASEMQLTPQDQSTQAADARPPRESPVLEAHPMEVTQVTVTDSSLDTPDAPAAHARAEANQKSTAPLETEPTNRAAMQTASAAQVTSAAMMPSSTDIPVDASRVQTQAHSAPASTAVEIPTQTFIPSVQHRTLAQGSVNTPQSSRSERIVESSHQDVASAAVSPVARPTPPALTITKNTAHQHTLDPDSSTSPALSSRTSRISTSSVEPQPRTNTALPGRAVSTTTAAPLTAAFPTPSASHAQPDEVVTESILTMPAIQTAHDTSRAPIGATDAPAASQFSIASLAPTASSQHIESTNNLVISTGESMLADIATPSEPSHTIQIDAPQSSMASALHLPDAVPQDAQTGKQPTQSIANDYAPLEQLRPMLVIAGQGQGAAPLKAPDIGLEPDEIAPALQHVPSRMHADESKPRQVSSGLPAQTIAIHAPVMPGHLASTLTMPGRSQRGTDKIAPERTVAGLTDIDMPSLARRVEASTNNAPLNALQIAPRDLALVHTASQQLGALQLHISTEPQSVSPSIPADFASSTFAMTDLAPLAFAIPEVPNTPQMYPQREEQTRQALVEQGGGTKETEAAVADALQWLATHQQGDGRWSGREFDDLCQCGGRSAYDFDKALTGLSLLCFLATNNTHTDDGPYRDTVARAVQWLVNEQRDDGSLLHDESMYSHGIATIALCEAYGMSGDPALREPAKNAVDFIVRARNDIQGGWRYEPGQPGDTSVLGWQVMAMESARKCGIDVPAAALDNARAWLDKVSLTGRPGLYTYQVGAPVSMSMTAEAMFVQQLLGTQRDEPRMAQSAQYILRELPNWDRNANTYGWYYATLALFQHRGDAWDQWNANLVAQLLAAQRADGNAQGSWDPSDRWSTIGGRVYQTAICCLTLEVYYRYLPRFVDDP